MTDGGKNSHQLLIETIDGYINEEVADETVRDAYERITDGFFAVDEDWEITYINRRATGLLNAERSEVLGDCLWDAFPDSRGTVFHEKSKEAMEGQRPISYEGYYGFLDKWFQVNAYPSEDGLSVYFRDVTEEKEQEKELELQACAVDRLNDILWIFEPGFSKVLFVNSAYEKVLGQSVEELDDDPTAFLDAVHPDDRDLMREKMEEVSSGGSVDFEVRVNPDEGYERWVWINGEPIYDDDGELTAVAGFARGVTERKEREQTISEMKERLSLAVGVGNLGVWDWKIETGEVEVNEEWYSMLDDVPVRSEDLAIGIEDWKENVHPDDFPGVWSEIENHLRGETEKFDKEIRMLTASDDWKWIRTVGKVVERDGNGQPVRAVGVHVDIDDRKSDERLLRRQNEYLCRIQDASREMIAAESPEEVEATLVDVGEDLFEGADFYSWEEGALRNGTEEVSSRGDSPAWRAFSHGEVVLSEINDDGETEVYEDIGDCPCFDEDNGDAALRLDAPVGEHGVFSVYCSYFCEPIESFVDSVVASAETSLERVEKESRLHEVVGELQEKNETLERVTEIDDVVRDLIKEVVEADSRETIEKTVCEQLLKVEGWEHAWIVEQEGDGIEPSCCCGEQEFSEALMGSAENSPLKKTLEDGEIRIVDDVATADLTDWRRTVLNQGYLSVATIPIEYGARSFGALEVYSSEAGAFDKGYADAIVDAAKVAGYAFTSAEQVSSILSGGFSRLTLRIDQDDADCFFARIVQRIDHEFRINAVVPGPEGNIVYFKTDADEEELRDAADSICVELSETMNGYGATVSEMSVVDSAMELGGRVSRFDSGEETVIVDVDLPQGTDARDLVNVVSERHPTVELIARKSAKEPDITDHPLDELTERQKTVLQLAYESGFFETPREKTGQDLAESLGITATTFHQHLRSAEKKIVDSILDEPE